jgi:stage II sporulation protein M
MIHRVWLEIHKFIVTHLLLFIFITVLFSISVLFGAIVVQALENSQKTELYLYFNSFLSYIGQLELSDNTIMVEALGRNLKHLGILWILGLSVIGLPVIIAMVFIKGFSIGFTVAFLIEQYSIKGLQLAIATILPQNLIIVPVTIFVGVAGIVFSIQLIQNRIINEGKSLFARFIQYGIIIAISILLIVLASCYEAYVAPNFFRFIEII